VAPFLCLPQKTKTMATTPEVQIAYLRLWAKDINAEVNEELSPKAQFTQFAVFVLGWNGGDNNWNRRWKECFGEDYAYPQREFIWDGLECHSNFIRYAEQNTYSKTFQRTNAFHRTID
jgi:hypothetical protein